MKDTIINIDTGLTATAADKYANAAQLPDVGHENFIVRVGGKLFRCDCGCNVFHKPKRGYMHLYECNGCGSRYKGA
jgi:hypothetical protein